MVTKVGVSDRRLSIDFHLDVVSPWCWIGLRNLRSAVEGWRQLEPEGRWHVEWHAAPLQPHIPDKGVPFQAFYGSRLGSPQAVRARQAQVLAAAQASGLDIRFDAIDTFPASHMACALINSSQTRLPAERMFNLVESIYAAYFEQGRNIGLPDVLKPLALAEGLSWEPDRMRASGQLPASSHASSVPTFVFNERRRISGALPMTDLLRAMLQE